MIQKINFKIEGIRDKSSQISIETEVEVLDGVESININSKTGSSSLRFDDGKISKRKIFNKIEELDCKVRETGNKNNNSKKRKNNIFIGAGIVIVIFIVFIFIFLPGEEKQTEDKSSIVKETANQKTNDGFLGEKGFSLFSENGQMFIDESSVEDGNMHFFNYFSEKGNKNIYFFVVKASDGTYRVAANACEVCHGAKKGFSQAGNLVQCDNCRITYAKDKIAKEKGGCNPGPIDDNALVENGKLIIETKDVEATAYLF